MGASQTLATGAGYAGTGLTALNAIAPSILAGTALASAPLTFGISAIPLAIQELSKIRAGARTADDFVQKYQDKFYKDILVPIAELKKTDPQAAAAELAKAWPVYLQQANQYAQENPTHAKVVQQMLYQTPALTNTVTDLLKPLGVNAFDPQFLGGNTFQSSNNGPSALAAAAPLIASGGIYGASQLLGGGNTPATPGTGGGGSIDNSMEIPSNIGSMGIPAANPPAPTVAPPPSTGASGIVGTLAKIFGVDTSKGDQGTIDSLIKMGVPLTASVLNGISATNAANTQAEASDKSAQLISDAAKNSLDFEKQVYGDQQNQTAPYRAAGTAALDKIQQYLGIAPPNADGSPAVDPSTELTTTPRYKLDFSEGIKALNAANRGIVSGKTIKAAQEFGQSLADKTFDSNFGNLTTVAGLGSNNTATNINAGTNAAAANTGINTNTAATVGNAQQNAAAARASGYGQGAFSQVLNQLQQQQLLKQIGL